MRYHEINEAFNAVQPFSWADHSNDDMELYQASFQIGDGLFVVQFKSPYYERGYYTLQFTRNNELDLTRTGNANTVLATVMAITREFIAGKDPHHITFAAKNEEASRNKLYPKLAAMMMAEFPQYTATQEKKSRTYTTHLFSRPKREYVAPPIEPTPEVEPAAKMSDEEWDELEALLNDLRS